MISFHENILDEEKIEVAKILPQWKTYVLAVQKSADGVSEVENLDFLLAVKSREEFKEWLSVYEENTKTKYTVRTCRAASGKRVIFRQTFVCHHKTRCERVHDPAVHKVTKNTNCPSKMIVTIHATHDEKYRYRGKFASIMESFKIMPCEVQLILKHNHSIGSAASLSFRKPSTEVKETLKSLFQKGHSPASALQCIQTDIQLNNDNYPLLLGDRSKCPDYNYCYKLYTKIFKKKFGPMDFNEEGKEMLQRRLKEYNDEVGSICSKMVVKDADYVICICTPLMKRVHSYIEAASKMAFMDSTGTLDLDGSRIFVLLTHSECGGLPLGILVTSSESCEILELGLRTLKEIAGEVIFGGNIDGPNVFLTDDSKAEQNAIRSCFSRSSNLLCIFHVLQAVWRWLIRSKNGVPQEKQIQFFNDFRKIMFSRTKIEAEISYNEAKAGICEKYKNYGTYLDGYWERRSLWALSYRLGMLIEGHNTNNLCEAFMRILKDKIFDRIQAFNVVQLVDFIITKVNNYFQIRLLDAANRATPRSFSKTIKVPSAELESKIKLVDENILLVPSEHIVNHYYIVNMAVLICTCFKGNTGKICKHIDWASTVCPSKKYEEAINNTRTRKMYYFIATGDQPPENWLQPLYDSYSNSKLALNDDEQLDTLEQMDTQEDSHPTVEEIPDTLHVENNSHEVNCELLGRAVAHLTELSKRSPDEMREAFKALCEVEKMKTPSACTSLLLKLREGNSRKYKGKNIYVQPTAISRRKKKLVGRRSNHGGRPRTKPVPIRSTDSTREDNIEGCGTSHDLH